MRKPHKCIYTSSWDRGLEHLLKIWPDVLKEVPDAELHIFYGTQLFEGFYRDNPASMAWLNRMKEQTKQPNVFDHGRVTQVEMKKELLDSGLFVYPTHFGEINCISAIGAQAWGAIPIVINYAALETTVKYGVKVDGDIYEPEVREKYKQELVKALKDEAWQEEIRPKMMNWARNKYSWDKIAIDWTRDFKEDTLKDAAEILIKEDPKSVTLLPVLLQQQLGVEETI